MSASLALVAENQKPQAQFDAEVVVLKFGSSVLKSPADAPAVASEIYSHVRRGRKVVAVVSALAGETDKLLSEARQLGLDHDNELLPAYVVLGEERAAALVAIACDRVGLDAVGLSVQQLGISAEGPSQHARPVALKNNKLREALSQHEVVVVPGFGAVRDCGRVALLGRGGSDLSAVVLAAELGLDKVRLVKDVDGLYDRDPACASGTPQRYRRASWETARQLGGALVQHDAIDLAENRNVSIEVAALGRAEGTVVGHHNAPPGPVGAEAPLKVVVAGCGVVGGGLLSRLLWEDGFEVVGVLVRDPFKRRDVDAPAELFSNDVDALLAKKPDLVIEALSEGEAGHDLIRRALAQGVDVVSANKQAVALDPEGLQKLANENGARVAWSASVGGGSPMIETLRAARAAGPVAGFEAVLNGTVNFMLQRLGEGADFADALADARAAGFAEEDPSSDLEGRDAAAKVKLLSYEAFGKVPNEVPCDALSAQTKVGASPVRQIGACFDKAGDLDASVRLNNALEDALFQSLNGERNALKVFGADGRVWACKGRGAGRWATTESVLADVADIVRARRAAVELV